MEPVIVLSILLAQCLLNELLELRLRLLFTHIKAHCIDQVLNIVRLKLINIRNKHQLQQVDKHIRSFSENLERLAALNLELFKSLLLDLLLRRCSIEVDSLLIVVGALVIIQVMIALKNINILVDIVFCISQDHIVMILYITKTF